MANMQGGDCSVIENPSSYPVQHQGVEVVSLSSGYVKSVDALTIGILARDLGAGRIEKEDLIDPAAGIVLHKKSGDPVKKGDSLATLYTKRKMDSELIKKELMEAYAFQSEKPEGRKMILGIVGGENIE